EQSIVTSQNLIDLNYLTLKELMQLDPAIEIKVERPEFTIPADANPEALTFGELYSASLGTQPQVRADELRLESAEVSVDLARSGFYPTLSLFGGLDSRWSGASKLYETETVTETVTQTFFIPSTQTSLDVQYDVPNVSFNQLPYSYFDQLQDNFGQNIGASLQIPLYSNGRNSIAVEQAKVGILNARVQADLTKQQLKNDVQQSLASARAARRTLDASQKSMDAAKVAFENAEKRFQLGAINNLQLLTARNTYDIAQTNLIVSKYDYLFRLKILDFYLGREIKLD
ncbi:MAG: TolC family protein, partial [Bacteroidetes bacterium]|nr:TolC family protein [Bacteroidota bacterium]